jgi:hypothetical protein
MTPDQIFAALAQAFPAVIAPGIVAYVRRRWPTVGHDVDGLLVWLAVVLAAVAWEVVIGLAFGMREPLLLVRNGIALGVVAASAHTLATGAGKPANAPAQSDASTLQGAPSDATPGATARPWPPKADLEWSDDKRG